MSKQSSISFEDFPNSLNEPFTQTSNQTINYNCIAWSVKDNTKWWWPNDFSYWPANLDRVDSIQSFEDLYTSLGYSICENGDLEAGFEKIVLFAINDKPTHAARQLENGFWTSKLGSDVDIEHTLESMNCGCYGSPVKFFKKRTP